MGSDVAGVTALCDGSILVRCTVGIWLRISTPAWGLQTPAWMLTNHVRAIILIVRFAELALQTGTDLSANTNTVSNLDSRHLVADFNGLANNFMTDADWKWAITPASSDGMDIGAANSAALNLDVDVTIFEFLRFELRRWSGLYYDDAINPISPHFFLFKVSPFALVFDHVALEHVWVRHFE